MSNIKFKPLPHNPDAVIQTSRGWQMPDGSFKPFYDRKADMSGHKKPEHAPKDGDHLEEQIIDVLTRNAAVRSAFMAGYDDIASDITASIELDAYMLGHKVRNAGIDVFTIR